MKTTTLHLSIAGLPDGVTAESLTITAQAQAVHVNELPTGTVAITGTPSDGEALSVDTSALADADGLGTLAVAWLRDGVEVSSGPSYQLSMLDVGASISAVVSYTDAGGTAESVTSAPVGPVQAAEVAPPPPAGTDRIGTRIYTVSTSNVAASTLGKTAADTVVIGQVMMCLEADFEAVRLLFANSATNGCTIAGVAVAAGPSTADPSGDASGLFAAPVTAPGFTLPGGTSDAPAFAASEWMDIESVPRADGSHRPLLYARVAFAAPEQSTPLVQWWRPLNTAWGSSGAAVDGRWLMAGWRGAPSVAALAGPLGKTMYPWGYTPIVGVQYRTKGGAVKTVAAFGDSITYGAGRTEAYASRSWVLNGARAASTAANPVEFICCAIPGKKTAAFLAYAHGVIGQLGIKPTLALFAAFTPNEGPGSALMKTNALAFKALCEGNGVQAGFWTGLPRNLNATTSFYGLALDNARKAYNAEMQTWGCPVLDMDAVISDGASPARFKRVEQGFYANFTNDWVHPSDAGDNAMAAVLTAALAGV